MARRGVYIMDPWGFFMHAKFNRLILQDNPPSYAFSNYAPILNVFFLTF